LVSCRTMMRVGVSVIIGCSLLPLVRRCVVGDDRQ